MDFYEEAAQEAAKNKTSIKEEMKHIDEYLERTYEYLFKDENDEIVKIINGRGFAMTNSAYTKRLITTKIKNMIQDTDKHVCVVLQKYGKVVAVISNCTMYISKKCTSKDMYIIKKMVTEQIQGE